MRMSLADVSMMIGRRSRWKGDWGLRRGPRGVACRTGCPPTSRMSTGPIPAETLTSRLHLPSVERAQMQIAHSSIGPHSSTLHFTIVLSTMRRWWADLLIFALLPS